MNDDCCTAQSRGGNDRYDLAVIGAGSAGFSAAITAAELGAHVAFEKDVAKLSCCAG